MGNITSNHCPTSANFVYCVGFTMKIVIALVLVACVYVQASPVRDGDDGADGSSVSNVCTIKKVDGKLVMSKGCTGAVDEDGSSVSNVCTIKKVDGKLVMSKGCTGAVDEDGSSVSNVCTIKKVDG